VAVSRCFLGVFWNWRLKAEFYLDRDEALPACKAIDN
jgi:hypothetical protein